MTLPPTTSGKNILSTFGRDVLEGLSAHPKRLPSKYFYDERGDKLFQQIMAMPEYYLTDCEREIFETQRGDLLKAIQSDPFELVELGAGDGTKTQVLIEHFLADKVDFVYRPIDISPNVLEQLQASCYHRWPNLSVDTLAGDYFVALEAMQQNSSLRKVVLFLGGNIGNFYPDEATRFLEKLRSYLQPGDFLLIGIDLKKNPDVIIEAYDDPHGITAAFNLNLLERINRELGGNFDLNSFRHWESYNPITGETCSFLISEREQSVHIARLGRTFTFAAWEAIGVEVSLKYSQSEIEALAVHSGFEVVQHFTDRRAYFVDSLWQLPLS